MLPQRPRRLLCLRGRFLFAAVRGVSRHRPRRVPRLQEPDPANVAGPVRAAQRRAPDLRIDIAYAAHEVAMEYAVWGTRKAYFHRRSRPRAEADDETRLVYAPHGIGSSAGDQQLGLVSVPCQRVVISRDGSTRHRTRMPRSIHRIPPRPARRMRSFPHRAKSCNGRRQRGRLPGLAD